MKNSNMLVPRCQTERQSGVMAYGVIYKITNKLDGKQYVGQTMRLVETRFKQHANNKKTHLGRAIRKYGVENFLIEILEECDTCEQLNEREMFWIAALNCKHPNGYNFADGGKGNCGLRHTQETRAQMSVDRSGEKNAFFNMNHTPETRFTLSVSHRHETPHKNLLKEMDARQLSYTALAKLMNLSVTNFASKMRGKYNFTDKDKAKLVEIFGKPIEYLLQYEIPYKTPNEISAKKSASHRNYSPYPNLIAELDARQLSYRALAKLLGLAPSGVFEKMRGKQNFTARDKAKLEEIFQKPIEYLLWRDEG